MFNKIKELINKEITTEKWYNDSFVSLHGILVSLAKLYI